MEVYVQFTDISKTVIVTAYASEQDPELMEDPRLYEAIDDSDARYITFQESFRPNQAVLSAQKLGELQKEATDVITPLQYAVNLQIATEDEVARLNSWMTYAVELSRVDTSVAVEIWPTKPR